jgi:hypothetical protein
MDQPCETGFAAFLRRSRAESGKPPIPQRFGNFRIPTKRAYERSISIPRRGISDRETIPLEGIGRSRGTLRAPVDNSVDNFRSLWITCDESQTCDSAQVIHRGAELFHRGAEGTAGPSDTL